MRYESDAQRRPQANDFIHYSTIRIQSAAMSPLSYSEMRCIFRSRPTQSERQKWPFPV